MISTDGGATWQPQATSRTTTEDPHGNAYGPGYTGQSGGWVQETVDLTPFVGGEVLVRFEMITDLAVNTPGMVIDDVRIPAIGYAENFEDGPGGWEAAGWLYIDNVLPQQWIVQAVRQQNGVTTVERLLSPGDTSQGEWTFDFTGTADRVTLVISPLAPKTTEPGAFTTTAERVE